MPKKNALSAEAKMAIESALGPSVAALRRLAQFKLQPSIERRMQDLGERKEFLGKAEHDELLAFVGFARQRTIEKLQAKAALQRLRRLLPDLIRPK